MMVCVYGIQRSIIRISIQHSTGRSRILLTNQPNLPQQNFGETITTNVLTTMDVNHRHELHYNSFVRSFRTPRLLLANFIVHIAENALKKTFISAVFNFSHFSQDRRTYVRRI